MIYFGRSQLCLYETSGKMNYLRTHCALHYFMYYAVTASCRSLFACTLLEKQSSNVFVLIVNYLHTYMMMKIVFFFTCARISTGSTNRLLRVKFINPCYFGNQHYGVGGWDISYFHDYCMYRITLALHLKRELANDTCRSFL